MKMKANSTLISQLRTKRAWSQQHLGEVSGISLRTIQRIEASGKASMETLMALATVFECDVEELISTRDNPQHNENPLFARVAGAIGMLTLVVSFAYYSLAIAEDGMRLDLAYEKTQGSDTYKAEVEYLLLFEETVFLDFPNYAKFRFYGREARDAVELEVSLYEYLNETETKLIGTSKATVSFGEVGTFTWSQSGKTDYSLNISPTRAMIDL